jgi:hypothetical protein
MARLAALSVLLATAASVSCATSTRWARLNTPHGQFAVDTANTKVLADGLVETWVKEVEHNSHYMFFFPTRTESETQIELDCINLLMRPKQANYWVDHRRTATRRAHPAERMWTDLADRAPGDDPNNNRAAFLYRHACEGTATAGYVTVGNQSPQEATISLYYRGRRVPLGTVGGRSSGTLQFSCPSDDFQFIMDLEQQGAEETGRVPERIPCHLTEVFYAEPGDTVSMTVPEDLDQRATSDVCPKPWW